MNLLFQNVVEVNWGSNPSLRGYKHRQPGADGFYLFGLSTFCRQIKRLALSGVTHTTGQLQSSSLPNKGVSVIYSVANIKFSELTRSVGVLDDPANAREIMRLSDNEILLDSEKRHDFLHFGVLVHDAASDEMIGYIEARLHYLRKYHAKQEFFDEMDAEDHLRACMALNVLEELHPDHWEKRAALLHVDSFEVIPKFRRLGVATKMFELLVVQALKRAGSTMDVIAYPIEPYHMTDVGLYETRAVDYTHEAFRKNCIDNCAIVLKAAPFLRARGKWSSGRPEFAFGRVTANKTSRSKSAKSRTKA